MAFSCSQVNLDSVSEKESKEIVELLNSYACDFMGGGEALAKYTQEHLVEELIKRKNFAHVFVARDGDKPIGLVISFEGFSTFNCRPLINLHDVTVIPEYRGKGVSRLLLSTVEEFARSINCCKMTLEVLEGNHPAKAAYTACGFKGYELDPTLGHAVFWEKKFN
jgi:GNAT superfamily N-acetyltransferase